MFALVLVGALVAQSALAAPQAGCIQPCSASQQAAGHGAWETKSGWSTRSSWSSGGGGRSGNLEITDENNIQPGSWEKHYVTDDGTGKIDYKGHQTVTNNGYSKYAEHSWSLDSRKGTHQLVAGAEVISSSEFHSQIQNIRNEIARFMGEFKIDSNFQVDQGVLDSFKIRYGILENQVKNFANGFEVNSNYYQRARQMLDDFQRQCQQIQRQMESMVRNASISSYTQQGSYGYRPKYSSPQPHYTAPAPQIDYEEKRINQETNQIEAELNSFFKKFNVVNYDSFNREESLSQFKNEAESQMSSLNQKLANLKTEAINHEASRKSIEQMIAQFQQYQVDIERRVQEVQQRIQQEQRRIREEFHRRQREEYERQVIEQRQKINELDAKKNEALMRERMLQEEKLRLEQQAAEEQHRLEILHHEKEELVIKQQEEIATAKPIQVAPSKVIQPVDLGPHLDVAAITSRLTQDLHRLQSQVTSFNSYIMQLTETNYQRVTQEAQRKAQQLRQNLNTLCEQSNRYHNSQIENSSEQLKTQFEQIFQSFQTEVAKFAAQASSSSHSSANYDSNSSWQTAGRVSQIRPATVTGVDYQHTKQTDVELVQQPENSQRYVSHEADDCVEAIPGQPCIQPTRYRRDVGGK